MVAKSPPQRKSHADEVRAAADRDIERFLCAMFKPGDVFEIRAPKTLDKPGGKYFATTAGYFNDPTTAARAVSELDASDRPPAIYVTLNPVKSDLLARATNRLKDKAAETTGDHQIPRRRRFLIDPDPGRDAGMSSTDEEMEAARRLATAIREALKAAGWPDAIQTMSGNGAGIVYAIDLPNDAESEALIDRCLKALAARYDGAEPGVTIDQSVKNAARITKIPGTLARKGDDFRGAAGIPARPWRRSYIDHFPDEGLVTVSRELLEQLAAEAPKPAPQSEQPRRINGHRVNGAARFETFEHTADGVRAYLERHGVTVKGMQTKAGAIFLNLDRCPVNPAIDSGGNNDLSVIVGTDGKIGYRNLHNRGNGMTWENVREALEPGYTAHVADARSREQSRQRSKATPEPAPTANGQAGREAEIEGTRPILKWACDVEVKRIEWLWERKLALGKINLICGEPGVSKSTLTTDLTARVTTCSPMPDGTPGVFGTVIIASAEDDQSDTIVPRLKEAGADLNKVVFLDGVSLPGENGARHERSFTLEHIAILADTIKSMGDCKLVVIDPVSAFLADADSHKNAEIRGLLAPLSKLAAEFGVCILLVTHLNKAAGGKAINRAMGSLAFVAAARSAWLVVKDQNNDRRRLFLPIKNNIGDDTSGMAFGVVGEEVPRIIWEHDRVTMKADQALASPEDEDRRTGPEPAAKNAAIGWLAELLADGPVESAKVKEEAKAAMVAWATVRRAQESIGIKPYKEPFGGAWMWKLPPKPAEKHVAHEDAQVTPTQKQHEQHEQREHL
jgi:hypothetical protein